MFYRGDLWSRDPNFFRIRLMLNRGWNNPSVRLVSKRSPGGIPELYPRVPVVYVDGSTAALALGNFPKSIMGGSATLAEEDPEGRLVVGGWGVGVAPWLWRLGWVVVEVKSIVSVWFAIDWIRRKLAMVSRMAKFRLYTIYHFRIPISRR
jgi:hypothetical protein